MVFQECLSASEVKTKAWDGGPWDLDEHVFQTTNWSAGSCDHCPVHSRFALTWFNPWKHRLRANVSSGQGGGGGPGTTGKEVKGWKESSSHSGKMNWHMKQHSWLLFSAWVIFVLLSELSANVRPGKSRDEHKESAKRTPIKSWKERPTPPQVRLFSLLLLQWRSGLHFSLQVHKSQRGEAC